MKILMKYLMRSAHSTSDFLHHSCLASAISLCVLLWLPNSTHAATTTLKTCSDSSKPLVTIGIQDRHRNLANLLHINKDSADINVALQDVCPVFAFGNDYQILDWLEMGKIDAAIVSPFVAELFHERGEKPLKEFFSLAKAWPFSGTLLPSYQVELQVIGPNGVESDAVAAYDDIIKSIQSNDDNFKAQIVVDSYLSAALPLLLDYTEHRLSELNLLGNDQDEPSPFWAQFMRMIELRNSDADTLDEQSPLTVKVRLISVNPPPREMESILILSGDKPLQDFFAHNKLRHSFLSTGDGDDTEMQWRANAVKGWLHPKSSMESTNFNYGSKGLIELLNNTYAVRESGFRKHRHFRFTLDELWQILGSKSQNVEQFALILTGGGVKAAYQTRMIDHLYGNGYLSNSQAISRTANLATEKPIIVDHIIGTSGGALLGTFVMFMDDTNKRPLTEILWTKDNGEYIGNFDVFPFFEMPRYLSIIVSTLLFSFLLVIFGRIPWFRRRTELNTLPARFQIKEQLQNTFPPRAVWVALLILSPWVIKLVNGVKGLEHVPAITGLFYLVFTLITITSDNRLIFKTSFRWEHFHFKGTNLILLIGGIVFAFVPFIVVITMQFDTPFEAILGEITAPTLFCCLGILSIFLAVHLGFANSGCDASDSEKVDGKIIMKGFIVLFLVPVISTVMVWLMGKSLLELSLEFWAYFIICSVLATALLIAVSLWPWWSPEKNFIKVGLDFLTTDFPKRTYFLNLKRHQRITMFAAMAFVYWNVVMAPAIYGNGTAKRYFEQTYKKAMGVEEMSEEEFEVFLTRPLLHPPKTNFVVSATSLEKQRERYFVFRPSSPDQDSVSDQNGKNLDERLDELIKKDPRWVAADTEVTQQSLLDVVFASGSPFPVFPPTRVGLTEEDKEWLVDGGFAHNVPIEAANALGAKRVLVISSSQLHEHDPIVEEKAESDRYNTKEILHFGNLIRNVPRLFPYLFERSQIEDAVSAEEILVATISPAHRKDGWPGLMDFQSHIVGELIDAADEDLKGKGERIGLVESWGSPVCEFLGKSYNCQDLKAIKTSRDAYKTMTTGSVKP